MPAQIEGTGEVEATVPVQTLVADDGEHLAYRYFPADSDKQRASIIYLHGSRSHGAWYVDTAAELARHGYSVYLPDRRGSGLNGGPRGYFRTRQRLVDDLRYLIAQSRSDGPELPVFLTGVCWGAKTALAYALQSPEDLAGLVLVCPALKTKVRPTPAEVLQIVLGQMVAPRRQVRLPLTPEMFTAVPDRLRFVREDPLSLQTAAARFFIETFLWDRYLSRQHGLTLPILLLQAGHDPIVDEPAVQAWFDRLASTRKTYIRYPTFGHTLDFEPERQRFWDDIVVWLDQATGGEAALPLVGKRRVAS